MPTVTIRRLTRSGDDALAVEPKDLADRLPPLLRNAAAAVRTDGSEAVFVGSDPALVGTLVRSEIAAGAWRVEVLVVPRIRGG